MRNQLQAMIELITHGSPDVVCLQEVPAWALGTIGASAGMTEVPIRAESARLGPLRAPAVLGRLASAPHSGLLSASVAGCGNVILIPATARIREVKSLTLNTNVFCEERGAVLGLSPKAIRAWQRPRRVAHLVKYELPDRRRFLVATLQATSNRADIRLADAELGRAVGFADRRSEVEEVVVVAGDFNVVRAQSETIRAIESAPPESRWTDSGAQAENVLLRGAVASSARIWSEPERSVRGRLLSDHAPVEVEALPTR
jgi:endonuclease/exonuclease/phosphatase family metal-dependent hydrolase